MQGCAWINAHRDYGTYTNIELVPYEVKTAYKILCCVTTCEISFIPSATMLRLCPTEQLRDCTPPNTGTMVTLVY